MRLAIVSGCYPPRFQSRVNHASYAARYGYDYYHVAELYEDLQTPHFLKLRAVLAILPKYDWVLWIDDDAFVVDFTKDMGDFVSSEEESIHFVACASPQNENGTSPFLNSGVFFVRNSDVGRNLLTSADQTLKADVYAEWNKALYGNKTKGEQTNLIHVLHRDGLLPALRRHEWSAFNARPYHWLEGGKLDQFPIVHFASKDKEQHIKAFAERWGLDEALLPKA